MRGRFIPVTVEEEAQAERSAAVLTVRVGVFAVDIRAGCDMDVLRRVAQTLASLRLLNARRSGSSSERNARVHQGACRKATVTLVF